MKLSEYVKERGAFESLYELIKQEDYDAETLAQIIIGNLVSRLSEEDLDFIEEMIINDLEDLEEE